MTMERNLPGLDGVGKILNGEKGGPAAVAERPMAGPPPMPNQAMPSPGGRPAPQNFPGPSPARGNQKGNVRVASPKDVVKALTNIQTWKDFDTTFAGLIVAGLLLVGVFCFWSSYLFFAQHNLFGALKNVDLITAIIRSPAAAAASALWTILISHGEIYLLTGRCWGLTKNGHEKHMTVIVIQTALCIFVALADYFNVATLIEAMFKNFTIGLGKWVVSLPENQWYTQVILTVLTLVVTYGLEPTLVKAWGHFMEQVGWKPANKK